MARLQAVAVGDLNMRVTIVTGLALVAMVAGCGGGDSAPQAKKALTSEDNAAAKAIVLKLEDFGDSGWSRDLEKDEDSGAGGKCADAAIKDLTETGKADGDDFTNDNAQAGSEAIIFKTPTEADTAFKTVASDKTILCIADALQLELAKSADDVKVGEIKSAALPSPGVGQQSAGYRLTVPFESKGFSLAYGLDIVFVQQGRAFAFGQFFDLDKFDQDLEKELLGKLSSRMPTG